MDTVRVQTEPPVAPVTLDEAREHCRLVASGSPPAHPDDDYLTKAIFAATSMALNFTNRALVQTVFSWRFDGFSSAAGFVDLPIGPGISVDSISYIDSAGNQQTFSAFEFVQTDLGGTIYPTQDWPTARGKPGDVTITLTAGYAPTADSPPDYRANIPQDIKNAILFAVGHIYQNRSAVETDVSPQKVPMTFEHILWPYRITGL